MKTPEKITLNLSRTISSFSVIVSILFLLVSCGQAADKSKETDQNSTAVIQADTTPASSAIAEEPQLIETPGEPAAPAPSAKNVTAEKPKTTSEPIKTEPVAKKEPEPAKVVTPPEKPVIVTPVPEKVIIKPPVTPETNWPVPAKYSAMKNPSPGSKQSIALGKELYAKHCKSCHGSSGKGDGPKAATLNAEIRSFQSSAVKSQKAGDLYYKSFVGRKEMPNYEKKITDEEDRWGVVNYILSL